MRKIWIMLLMISSVCALTACTNDDDGDDNGGGKSPITELTLSDEVSTGMATTILGKGFQASDQLFVTDAEGARTEAEEVKTSATGITFTLPETLVSGKYSLILKRGADEWTLGEFKVVQMVEVVQVKKFTAKTIVKEEGMEDWEIEMVWDLGYDDYGNLISFSSTAKDEDGNDLTTAYEFTWTANAIEIGGNAIYNPYTEKEYPTTYTLQDGLVKTSKALVEGGWGDPDKDLEYTWTYDAAGYLKTLTGGEGNIAYTFENGNLVSIVEDGGIDYAISYSNKVNESGIDYVAYYLHASSTGMDRVWPYILGVAGKISKNIPASARGLAWQDVTFDTATGLLKSFYTLETEEGSFEMDGEIIEYRTTNETRLSFEYDTVRVLVN